MTTQRSIGKVSQETGVAIRTIRFYEAEGVLPAPARTTAGYRVYSAVDVRRLRLIRNARALGLGLPAIRELVEQAFTSDCRSFAPQLVELIATKRADVTARMVELHDLKKELDELEQHVLHAACATEPGRQVVECEFCPMIDEAESDTRQARVGEAIELLNVAIRQGVGDAMQRPDVAAALQIVGCDIGVRPAGAPVLDDIRPHLVSVRREPERLTVEFDARAAELVQRFVAAEQRCCSELRFSVIAGERTIMQVEAPASLIDAVAGWMTPG